MGINREYLKKSLVGIIAPAGYGKTEEIAEAVKVLQGKQLLLTHTRAGVAALRERLSKKNISSDNYEINTIAAFCLMLCAAYPSTAGLCKEEILREPIDYKKIYFGAKEIIKKEWAIKILRASYSGIFVDEYQDCTETQHELFLEMSKILPLRIYGDPLQGILYWIKGERIVNWDSFCFPIYQPLEKPWRWEYSNPALGRLLEQLRNKLIPALAGKSVTINLGNVDGCMETINSHRWNNGTFVYGLKHKKIVYLSTILQKQTDFSLHTAGYFQFDEKKDLSELKEQINRMFNLHGTQRALEVISFLKKSINRIGVELNSYINNLEKDNINFSRIRKHKEIGALLSEIVEKDDLSPLLQLLRWFWESDLFTIYRKENIFRMGKILTYMYEDNLSFDEAVKQFEQSQYMEKGISFPRVSSRTVLTKGLEFECVIIDARQKMDVRDFYVAMTRATEYIYIISDDSQLTFDPVIYN